MTARINPAMAAALELAEATGRAYHLGWEFTDRDFRRLPERNLIDVLLMYTWSTRRRRDLVPHYRARARVACRAYRALMGGGAARRGDRQREHAA